MKWCTWLGALIGGGGLDSHLMGPTSRLATCTSSQLSLAVLMQRRHPLPIQFAVKDGHVEVARCLLDAGAGMGERTKEGATALYIAARCVRVMPCRH